MSRHWLSFTIISFLVIGTPTATPAADQTPKFQQIHMVDATNGWAVVTVPDPKGSVLPGMIYMGTLGYVLHTQDGGQTWTKVTPPVKPDLPEPGNGCDCTDNGLAGFFFLDAAHAWVETNDGGIRGNQAFNGINVWATKDSGKTWHKSSRPINSPAVITSDFIDPVHGWLLLPGMFTTDGTEPAFLYRTTDGGMNWQFIADDGTHQYYDPPTGTMIGPMSLKGGITPEFHTGMAFESASSGWMTVSTIDPATGKLLHTTDGGKTWHELSVVSNALALKECGAFELQVYAANVITFLTSCTMEPYYSLYRITNAGKIWRSTPLPDNIAVFMLTETTGWLVGCESSANSSSCSQDLSGVLTTNLTTDGGKTWIKTGAIPDTLHPEPGNYIPLSDFDFIDDHTGWIIDLSGRLLTTKDAGKTWTPVITRIE